MQLLSAMEYRLLVENSPVMIWRSGVDTLCDYFNETWLSFTGRTLEQEMGEGWAEGVHPDDLDRCVSHYLENFHRREPFEMEYRLRRHDGVYRWIFDRGVPFNDASGVFAGFIGSCIDVDERRRTQENRARRDQERIEMARSFERWILAIVSHDIRGPLGAIQTSAHYIQRTTPGASPTRAHAELISRGVDRIESLVRDLLDVSAERDGSGIVIRPDHGDLGALCEQIAAELQPTAADRKITVQRDGDTRGSWDEHRIYQAVANLVGNALRHGTPGTPVDVRVAPRDGRLAVEVRNEGAIPDDVVPHLFEPFHSRRDRASSGGLGLGLFIARAVARAHGGELEVERATGRTTFRMVLPRDPTVRAPDEAGARADLAG